MHHVRVQHVCQIGGSSSLRLIVGIVDLCAAGPVCAADGDTVAVIGEEKSVDEVRSLVRRRCIQNPKLWRNEVGAGQSKIGREVTEHRRWIEYVLTQRHREAAGRTAYQNTIAGRIEGTQQVCH